MRLALGATASRSSKLRTEITMKESTKKLRDQAIAEIKPLVEQLAKEGLRGSELLAKSELAIRSRINAFYKKNNQPEHIGNILKGLAGIIPKADSKAEVILYNTLEENEVPFKFQYPIGPYTADFLVNESLVIELDGPGHNQVKDDARDAYMRRLGYWILRVPIWILAINPQAVIEEIKCKPMEVEW